MSWSNLSLAKKLLLPILFLGALLAALSAIQISTMKSVSADYSSINEIYLPAVQLVLNADRDLYQAQIAERTISLGMNSDRFRKMHKENLDQVQTRIGKVRALAVSDDARRQADQFLAAFNSWRPKSERLVEGAASGKLSIDESSAMSEGTLDKEFESVRDVLDVLGEMLGKEAEALQENARANQSAALGTIMTLVIIALIIAVTVGVTFPRLITGPVNQLSQVLGQMADGRGDLTIRMPDLGQDEIGRMSHNFNRFIAGMQQMIETIKQVANEVSGSSQHLKSGASDSQRISGDYAHIMDTVATANHEMGLAIQEVSANTQQVSEEARIADQSAKAVSSQFRQAMTEIQSLAQNVNHSGSVIEELAAETTNIASVLDVIKGIAEQTNLLALNAAIEAARAGEQGRGFAVVADEVRTLASKTQQSTGDINVMIEKLRAGVGRAVSTMNESQQKAEKTVEYASQSESSIHRISETMVSISDRILQVASAIEEQTSVINEINENLVSAKDLSGEGSRSTSLIANAADNLNRQAGSLNEEVSNFRT
ncbi:methyl-accepting chemotaxis protein [Thalassolituus sp. LLYu03]|uniref:methyl-accepting chemotaxis protein n=1 Tax=Thalassolituus sp. LLYu03 TaxID=3421656 RepID=UPI003D2A9D7D